MPGQLDRRVDIRRGDVGDRLGGGDDSDHVAAVSDRQSVAIAEARGLGQIQQKVGAAVIKKHRTSA